TQAVPPIIFFTFFILPSELLRVISPSPREMSRREDGMKTGLRKNTKKVLAGRNAKDRNAAS
ncbi:MAG: hypothetical protein WBI10_06630, partial [Syntrophales bacterium]